MFKIKVIGDDYVNNNHDEVVFLVETQTIKEQLISFFNQNEINFPSSAIHVVGSDFEINSVQNLILAWGHCMPYISENVIKEAKKAFEFIILQ